MKDVNNRHISSRFPKVYDKLYYEILDMNIKNERKGQVM
jgi:hypothetical protein